MFPLAGLAMGLGGKLLGAIKKNPLGALKVGAGIVGGAGGPDQTMDRNELDLRRRQQAWKESQDRVTAGYGAQDRRMGQANANAMNPVRRSLLAKISGSMGLAGPQYGGPIGAGANPLPPGMAMPTGYGSDLPPGVAPPKKKGGLLGKILGVVGGGLLGAGVAGAFHKRPAPQSYGPNYYENE